MKLIDIHAHLEHQKFEKDLDKVIENAKKENLKLIINSGVNPETNRKALEISEKYPLVKVSFGLYPIDALMKEIEEGKKQGNSFLRDIEEFDVDEELKWIEKNRDKCIAIGEIGLDYNWKEFQEEKERELQKAVFRKVLALAKKINKPVIIHSRKAEEDAINILEELKNPKVIMHCFSGRKSLIKRCIENKWYFSIPPVIKRLLHFQTLVEMVPIEQLLTETDSPYLSHIAGERNEPKNVKFTIEEIARIKSLDKEKVADKIFENTEKVFNMQIH